MTATAAARWAARLTLLCCLACRSPSPPPIAHAEMARDQLFFVAQTPEPVLLALIVQRTRTPTEPGATLEVKAFLVARDRLQSLFWERVQLDAWPGDDLQDALAAWQKTRTSPGIRLKFAVEPRSVSLNVRQPSGGFALDATDLQPLGTVPDPHGEVTARAGVGTLEVNGKKWRGPVLAERLAPGSQAWPQFGQFEMWLAAPTDGALWLGRFDLQRQTGRAAVVAEGQAARIAPFQVTINHTRDDAESGFALPDAWTVGLPTPVSLTHAVGQLGRGTAPKGGAAVYDIGVASGSGATALVFHLQDQ